MTATRAAVRSGNRPARLFPAACCILALLLALPSEAHGASVPSRERTTASPASRAKKAILLLFPYQLDLASSDLAIGALREEFGGAADLDCELFFEFLDLNRFADPIHVRLLLELIAARYRDRGIDLIVAQSPRVLDLWLENRARILPSTPVLFFDATAENIASHNYPADVRGVEGVYDFSRSVEWILRAKPSINDIVLIHGMGAADQRTFAFVESLERDMEGRVLLRDISSLPMAGMKKLLAALPSTSAALYFLLFEDAAGVKYRPIEALKELSSSSAVPILTGFEQFIGAGSIGGYMYSIDQQARIAARMGLQILRGEKPESIPIARDEGNRFIFDHQALLRYGLPLSSLPPGSIVKNRRYSAWELYRSQLIAAAIVFTLLVSLVALLVVAMRKLQSARGALGRINSELETQVLDRTSALEKSLGENSALLAELQHRAKNSFAMISSLMSLSSSEGASDETRRAIGELDQRVRSVSELYSLLYSSGSFTELRLDEYCSRVVSGMAGLANSARLVLDLEPAMVSAKAAAPIGLILTELVTNALKYGQPKGRQGTIAIVLKKGPRGASLEISDDGPGLPPGFDPSSEGGTGLLMVRALASQINGTFEIEGTPTGTRCMLDFAVEGGGLDLQT